MEKRNQSPVPRKVRREQERAQRREAERSRRQGSGTFGRRRLVQASSAVAALAALGGAAYFFTRSDGDQLPSHLSDIFVKDHLARYNQEILAQPNSAYWPAYYSSRLGLAFFCQEMNAYLGTNEYQREFFDDKLQVLDTVAFKRTADEVNDCTIEPELTFAKAFVHPRSPNIYQNWTAAIWSDPTRPYITDPFPAYNQFNTAIHEGHHSQAPIVPAGSHISIADYKFDRPLQIEFVRGLTFSAFSPGESRPGRKCYRPIRYEIDEAVVEHNKIHLTRRLGIPGSNVTDRYVRWIGGYERLILPLFNDNRLPIVRAQQSSNEQQFFEEVGVKAGFPIGSAYSEGIRHVSRIR